MGRRLSHFDVLERIGSGGMGEVYRARDVRLGREVAIKILSEHALGDPQLHHRFLHEAKAASALNHPNIITIYETDTVEGTDLIAMEYVRGRPLSQVIGDRLSLPQVLDYAIQIGEALAAAHEHGIVHRDLKPANVMVNESGQVKVLDFGLARWRPPAGPATGADESTIEGPPVTTAGAVLGTPYYMSPEQAAGKPTDARSDLFAFGVLLYEMISGRRPFTGATPVEVLSAVLRDAPSALTGVPPAIDRIVRKCLEKDPAFRYQHARDLVADLRTVERDQSRPAPVPAGSPVMPSGRSRRRRLLVVAVAGIAVAAAAVWAAWVVWHGPAAPQPANFQLVSSGETAQRAPSLSPDASLVAFISDDADSVPQVWVKNLAQGEPKQITTGTPAAERPRWSPKNDQIVFGRAGVGLWSVPPLGGTPHQILDRGRNARFSADGSLLVFERAEGIWVANSDGSDAHPIASVPASYFAAGLSRMPAFSPDGRFIVYFQPQANRPSGDLWVVPVDGGGQPRRLAQAGFGGEPVWTPDGRSIVFVSNRTGSVNLWSVPAAGGTPQPLTTGAGEDTDPEISRDGRTLIYTNTRKVYAVTRLDPAAGTRTRVLERRQVVAAMSLAPSGNRLAFFSPTDHGDHLATIGIDGQDEVWLTSRSGESNIVPQWSGDGRWIYFYRTQPDASFRRIPSAGGPSVELLPHWSWVEKNGARVDPSGRLLVYSALEPDGTVAGAMVRNLDTGQEHPLGAALRAVVWSRDGRFVFGTDANGMIDQCPVAGEPCGALTKGLLPRVSADGRAVYFLRTENVGGQGMWVEAQAQVWAMRPDGTDQRRVADLGSVERLTFGYGVRPNGEIVWNSVDPGRGELWRADLR